MDGWKVLLITSVLLLVVFPLPRNAAAIPADHDLQGRTVTFTDFGILQSFFEDARNEIWLGEVEEAFNCTVEIEHLNPHGGMESATVQRMIEDVVQGDDTVDMHVVGIEAMPGLVREGLIQSLDQVLEEMQYFDHLPTLYQGWDFVRHMGRSWGVDRSEIARNVEGIAWNKDLFAREGLPDLYTLKEEGEWTWEVFRDIAVQATRDTTGDGETDQFGAATFQHYPGSPKFLLNWAYSNNATPTRTVEGRELFAFGEPEALEAMEYWRDLLDEDAVRFGELWRFRDGRAAFLSFHLWMSIDSVWHGIPEMEDDWGVVPYPMGPHRDRYTAPMNHSWVLVAPVTNPNPEESLAIHSAMLRRSSRYVDDVDALHDELWHDMYRVNYRDRETDANARWLVENMEFVSYVDLLLDAGFNQHLMQVWDDAISPSAAMSEFEPVVQALIDEYFEQ